jgi:hypothetical protein
MLLSVVLILGTHLCSFGQVVKDVPDTLKALEGAPHRRDNKPRMKSFVVPAVLIGYGAVSLAGDNAIRRLDYSTHAELQEDFPDFFVKVDNYLRYIPGIAVYGLDLIGVKAKNDILDRSMMLVGSYALVSVASGTVKGLSNRSRPNGSNDHSFPSGHASMAFMTAEFLHQEYKDQSIWYSVGGYAVATGTGILRLYNDAHWVSDVVAGAGFGILSTKLVYLVYPYIKRKLHNGKSADIVVSPGYQNGGMTFNFIKKL